MLSHHPQHPRPLRNNKIGLNVDADGDGVTFASSSSSSSLVGIVPRSRSGDRLRPRADKAHLARVVLPIPILHRNSRSMSAVPTKRSVSAAESGPLENPYNGLGSRKPTRLITAMRRSSSYGRRSIKGLSGRGMFSTAEERSASVSPAGSRPVSPGRTLQPPSIAQIAMGLHTSRTPHLGPGQGHFLGSDPGARSAAHLHPNARGTSSPPSRPATVSSSTRVATPLRPSLKKADASRSASPSASGSSILSSSRSTFSRISLVLSGGGGGRSRLDKFLGRGLKSGSGSVASLNSSETDLGTPRKAVRFMSVIEDEGDSARRNPIQS